MSKVPKHLERTAAIGMVVATLTLGACGSDTNAEPDSALAMRVAELEARAKSTSGLKAKLAYLADRQQIHDLYTREGTTETTSELIHSTFWPDVQINYGAKSGSAEKMVVAGVRAHMELFSSYSHLITNEYVEIAGDTAHVESYVTEMASLRDGKSRIVVARYVDRLDRRNGEWRVAVREVIFEFFTEIDNALKWRVACGLGTWDKRDPAYRRPLTTRTEEAAGVACAEPRDKS